MSQPDNPLLAPFADAHLPMLHVALDAEAMSNALEPFLQSLRDPDSTPTVTSAKLHTFKQDHRGLIHYEVAGTVHGEVCSVFGKVYAEPGRAAQVYQLMQLLWNDVFSGTSLLGIPQPLGCIPELSMLLYLPAEGQFLDAVIATKQGLPCMGLVGEWLATLHRQPLEFQKRFSLATELVNLGAWAALVGDTHPDEAEAATQIARQLQEYAGELQLEAHVPIHKDFHYGHVIINRRAGLDVIDFDEMRLGDRNFDLAHFCANFDLLAYRNDLPAAESAALQHTFLEAYARSTGWTADARFRYFYAYTCLKIAKQLCTMRGPSPRPEAAEQHRQVRLVLYWGLNAFHQDAPGRI